MIGRLSSDYIQPLDLYLAYRKAKVNMFYERQHVTAEAFVAYEEDLVANIDRLRSRLLGGSAPWYKDRSIVGTYSYIPKELNWQTPVPRGRSSDRRLADELSRSVISDPDLDWSRKVIEHKPTANFRLVGQHPVDLHIIAALWINKVGHKYDMALGESAYGTRLRRSKRSRHRRKLTSLSLGSFEPYVPAYQAWRSKGFDAIRESLRAGRNIIALTTDVRSFYHEVAPDFILSHEMLDLAGIAPKSDDARFTAQLVAAIRTWSSATPKHASEAGRGVPVGLSAARVIANVALIEFDRFIERSILPIHYGRYVDDIFLVIGNEQRLTSATDLWAWLAKRSDGLLLTRKGESDVRLVLRDSRADHLRFGGSKQRAFALSGTSGLDLLSTIEKEAHALSSEWRQLPELEADADGPPDFITAGRDSREEVDSLRKSDGVSVQRLAFALALRDYEGVERDLQPKQWELHRRQFFQQARDHILTATGLFTYAAYIPRLVGLAVAAGDWEAAFGVCQRVDNLFQMLSRDTVIDQKQADIARRHLLDACYTALVAALGPSASVDGSEPWVVPTFNKLGKRQSTSVKDAVKMGKRFFERDLARIPFRRPIVEELADTAHAVAPDVAGVPEDVRKKLKAPIILRFLRKVGQPMTSHTPASFVFPTRPLRAQEITHLAPACLKYPNVLRRYARAFRGTDARVYPGLGRPSTPDTGRRVIGIPLAAEVGDPIVALPCFHTSGDSWTAAVCQQPDPDATRYLRLTGLINRIIAAQPRPRYVVLPELAIPERWFWSISAKLAQSRISLITGIEYRHHSTFGPKGEVELCVTNEARASLITDSLGYLTNVTYRQEKGLPSLGEETNLWTVGGRILRPMRRIRRIVVQHGSCHFGLLLCSELLNLKYRAAFRGKIDALFVLEWNRDTYSFEPLVEGSALDIHTFIVQSNNREYGDCRVRGPFKDRHRRDVVRITGGEEDYFVLAKLPIKALRQFQSHHRSPLDGAFKPVPDGFQLAELRRDLPKSGHHGA
ncbi:MAG TPA: RNA-directed DNA polymerase [Gemmatimonadaceae bacterium]